MWQEVHERSYFRANAGMAPEGVGNRASRKIPMNKKQTSLGPMASKTQKMRRIGITDNFITTQTSFFDKKRGGPKKSGRAKLNEVSGVKLVKLISEIRTMIPVNQEIS